MVNIEATDESEVFIIRAGLSGLALANILGMYGHSVTVLESRDSLIDYPRGVGLDDESFRTLQTLGLAELVRPHTTPQHIMRLVNGAGRTILENNPQTQEFGWHRKHSFIQPEVDRVLYGGLSRFENVRVLFGHTVETVEEDADSVTAIALLSGTDGGEGHRFRARYLVGCEGGKSPPESGSASASMVSRHPRAGSSTTSTMIRSAPRMSSLVLTLSGPTCPSAFRTPSVVSSSCCTITKRKNRPQTPLL